jgi:zinc protease
VASPLVLTRNRRIHRTTLTNGITVLVTENPAADIVSARMFLKAGSRYEPRQKSGLAHLLASVLTKGTERYTSLEIAEQVESIGASLGTDAAADYFLTSIKIVSPDFPQVLALAGEVMRFPTFPDHEVELERRLTLQSIRSQREQPFNVAMDKLRHSMYGDHPYAMSSLGSEASVQALTREDLVAYHQQFFRPDRLVISIAGRIDPTIALAQVEQVFGDWPVPSEPWTPETSQAVTTQPNFVPTVQDTQQSIVMLGYLAPAMPCDLTTGTADVQDYAALTLVNTYLGSGLSSRLFVELREKRGLAYEVSAFYPTRLDRSQFVVYMGTAPENTQAAWDGLKSEVDRLVSAELSQAELQVAKDKMLGQYALGKQTNAQLAQMFGWYESVGLGVEFDQEFPAQMAAVTTEMIQVAAQRHFGQPYGSVLGPGRVVDELVVE